MKKVLLAGTALVGVAMMAHTAHADLKLDLGGYFRGYGVWTDNDEDATNSLRQFDFLRDSEIHFTGETTTDMGLTVGVHTELKVGNESRDSSTFSTLTTPFYEDPTMTDEAYAYFSGGWGRINLGSEDGAAYLLQVAAPSADSNVDGLRVYVQGFRSDVWDDGAVNFSSGTGAHPFSGNNMNIALGYDNADFRQAERITYLTPKWNGFQAGVSYAAEQDMQDPFGGSFGQSQDNVPGLFENLWEASARWDGEFNGFGISLGGGYSNASAENEGAVGTYASDDLTTWNGGLNVSYQGWSLGGAYKHSNTGVAGPNTDERTWVVGLGWDNGPWHAGASWYNRRFEANAYGMGLTDDLDVERWTFGGGYTFGPGMSFRGSVAMLNTDTNTAAADVDQWQVAVGTDINF